MIKFEADNQEKEKKVKLGIAFGPQGGAYVTMNGIKVMAFNRKNGRPYGVRLKPVDANTLRALDIDIRDSRLVHNPNFQPNH